MSADGESSEIDRELVLQLSHLIEEAAQLNNHCLYICEGAYHALKCGYDTDPEIVKGIGLVVDILRKRSQRMNRKLNKILVKFHIKKEEN